MIDNSSSPLEIGVIGAGVAGLSCAWLLRLRHRVTLFEQAPELGGHSKTVDVREHETPVRSSRARAWRDAAEFPVDVGFIVYNEVNYPNLVELFRHLGVATQPSDMSFAVSMYDGAREYSSNGLDGLFAQRGNIVRRAHWKMLAEVVRFNLRAREVLERDDPDLSLGRFLAERSFDREFVDAYLLPMTAAIWSCPPRRMLEFPAASLVRFFDNHGLLRFRGRPRWRTVTGGSRSYVRRLARDLEGCVHRGTPVAAVDLEDGTGSGGRRRFRLTTAAGASAWFDRIVVATHADQARRILGRGLDAWRDALDDFEYQPNAAWLHRDTSLMPRRRRAWAAWNYLVSDTDGAPAVTYWMNRLQQLPAREQWLVTLNPPTRPRPSLTSARFDFEHPMFDARAIRSQARIAALQGHAGLYACGSYLGHGFHEDALRSSCTVATRLGAPPPWRAEPTTASELRERMDDDRELTAPAPSTGLSPVDPGVV